MDRRNVDLFSKGETTVGFIEFLAMAGLFFLIIMILLTGWKNPRSRKSLRRIAILLGLFIADAMFTYKLWSTREHAGYLSPGMTIGLLLGLIGLIVCFIAIYEGTLPKKSVR